MNTGLLNRIKRAAGTLLLLGASAQFAAAESVGGAGYMITRDRLEVLTSGAYSGLANPNFGRLTLLYNHGDHFHSIGAYSLSGPAATPTVLNTNTNNRVPEVSSLQAPLALTPGSGLYAGKLVSTGNEAVEYGDLRMVAFDVLLDGGPGSEESILASSSRGRWLGSLAGVRVGIEVMSLTPGLNFGDLDTLNLASTGGSIEIGSGAGLEFSPVFWVDAGAAPGTYSAALRFLDLGISGAPLSLGGVFNVDFSVPVPVPAAVWMMLSALAPLALRRRSAARDVLSSR